NSLGGRPGDFEEEPSRCRAGDPGAAPGAPPPGPFRRRCPSKGGPVMSFWNRLREWFKAPRPRQQPHRYDRAAVLAAPQPPSPAGWWREDHAEQLRHYKSWV